MFCRWLHVSLTVSRMAIMLGLSAWVAMPSATAAPIGRPITAEHQWVAGVIGGVERVDVKNRGTVTIGDLNSSILLGEAAYGFTPDAEFYLRLGGSGEEYELGVLRDLGASTAWGIGLRSVLYESWRDWRILGDIQYLSRSDHAFGTADIDIWEYQFGSAVEVRFDAFYPYAGVFYNHLEVESNNQAVYRDQRNDKKVGVYGGIGWEPRPEWVLHAEARLIHGPSVSGGVAYRF